MTFSIVARCPGTGVIGAATATAGPAVGALVLHGASLTGAIATQAMTNPVAGLKGIEWLQQGLYARACLEMMLAEDDGRDLRQWLIIDSLGQSVDWTGRSCLPWCGSLSEENLAIAGNMLVGEQVIKAMRHNYQQNSECEFAERLLLAMQAGAKAGGDYRGIGSAALKVWNKRQYADIDIRCDWSTDPLGQLVVILKQVRAADYVNFFAQLPTGNDSV